MSFVTLFNCPFAITAQSLHGNHIAYIPISEFSLALLATKHTAYTRLMSSQLHNKYVRAKSSCRVFHRCCSQNALCLFKSNHLRIHKKKIRSTSTSIESLSVLSQSMEHIGFNDAAAAAAKKEKRNKNI